MQDQSAALTYLPSESRSKIVAANQICAAMNAAKNAYAAMMKPNRDSKRSIAPSLVLSSVAGHTPASISAQRFLVRKLDAVERSSRRLVSSDLHPLVSQAAEIISEALSGALRDHASRDIVA
jgi:hypothetical protein